MKLGFYDFSKISLRKFWTEILFQIINYATMVTMTSRLSTSETFREKKFMCNFFYFGYRSVEKPQKLGEPRINCNTSIFGIVRTQILCRIT